MSELRLLRGRRDALLEVLAAAALRDGLGRTLAVAAIAHGALAGALTRAPRADPVRETSRVTELFELPPPPPPPPPLATPEPEIPARPASRRPERAVSAPARAAAAAAVVTRSDDAPPPLDLTDEIVIGSAAVYAGGATTSTGSSARPVRGAAQGSADGAANGGQHGARGELGDRSRRPGVSGGLDWRCPFPRQADVDGIDRAVVTLRVDVDANARPARVAVLRDPGHGFADAARRCALGKRWVAALDADGRAIAASLTVSVRFVR